MRRSSCVVCSGVLAVLSGCAWTNRDNRPVWNAFESHLVPESSTTFALTLPFTVPVGFAAILADTLFVHPLRVVDDAAHDALDVWDNLTIRDEHYYTNVATVPFRALGTPVVFSFSWLGRSLFDLPPYGDLERRRREAEAQERRDGEAAITAAAAARAAQRQEALAWLAALAARRSGHAPGDVELDDEVRAALRAASEGADAEGRLLLYRWAAQHAADGVDWSRALGDPSAVVRHAVVSVLPATVAVPLELQRRLCADADEAVRLVAERRFEGR